MRLHVQSDIKEMALTVIFEELEKCETPGDTTAGKPRAWEIGRKMAADIRRNELKLWEKIGARAEGTARPEAAEWISAGVPAGGSAVDFLRPVLNLPERAKAAQIRDAMDLFTWISERGRQKVIYAGRSAKRVLRDLSSRDVMRKRLGAIHASRLAQTKRTIEKNNKLWTGIIEELLENIEKGATFHIRKNCAKALGVIYPKVNDEELRKRIARDIIAALSDHKKEVALWASWAVSINNIRLDEVLAEIEGEIERYGRNPVTGDPQLWFKKLGDLYYKAAAIYDFEGDAGNSANYYRLAQESYRGMEPSHGILVLKTWLALAGAYERLGDTAAAVREYLHLVNPQLFAGLFGAGGALEALHEYRRIALTAILNIHSPYSEDANRLTAQTLDYTLGNVSQMPSNGLSLDEKLRNVTDIYYEMLSRFRNPYLALLLIYGTDILRSEAHSNASIAD
jgi:hypothetical protein